jgi:hypothetical protein
MHGAEYDELVEATKAYEGKMTIKIAVTLMNDRSGQQVKSDTITLALDNEEIKGLLEEDEDADLLQAALSKLAEPLEAWIKGN